jgi:hypothetical protein
MTTWEDQQSAYDNAEPHYNEECKCGSLLDDEGECWRCIEEESEKW